MQYDLSIIEKLWQKYCYKDSQGLKSDRKLLVKEYANITGIDIPEATLKHYIKRLDRERLYAEKYGKVESDAVIKHVSSPKSELDINQDGTHKLLVYSKMTSDQSKDPNYVMDANGYPSDLWELVNLRVNEWGSTTNPDNQYYQIRLTVKPKTIDGLSMDDINKLMITNRTPIKPITYEAKQTDKSMALMITDKHVGLSIVNDELFKQIIEQARVDAISNDVEHIYLYNLGDFLHVDNASETTDKGTQLKTEISPYRMWDKAVELMSYAIERLSFVPLTFTWTQGNHSRLAEYSVMNAVRRDYSKSDHITFNIDESYQKANLIYNTFIGVFHGDMPRKNYTNWSQFQFSELWGKAQRWEQYSGHLHSKEVFTVGGLEHTILGTMKPTDRYEQSLGYGNYRPTVEAYIYDRDKGKTKSMYY